MKRYHLFFIAFAFVLFSCENSDKQTITKNETEQNTTVDPEEIAVVDLSEFSGQAENLVGKTIVITGIVDHVCKHGGQKMVIVSKDTDKRLKIFTGENMAAFNTDLEGENVMVTGIVEEERVDEDYLRDWEQEVLGGTETEPDKLHTGQGHENEEKNDNSAELEQINKLRKRLQESGKDHLSFYSLVCQEYKVVDDDQPAP